MFWAYRHQKRCKMRKDFVKKTNSNRKSRIYKKESPISTESIGSNLKWYSAGTATGVVLSLLVYLLSLPEDKRKIISESSEPKKTSSQVVTGQKTTQFEFYDILPEIDGKHNKSGLNTARNKNIDEDKIYFLQAGAFKKRKDAENRRAKLVLLDLDPQIKLTQEENDSLYRLTIGPLRSLTEAKKVQKLIESDGIKTLLKKRVK